MAKHIEAYNEGHALYVITCALRGCSWSIYDVVDELAAKYYDDAHAAWHIDQHEAEVARMKRRDGLC